MRNWTGPILALSLLASAAQAHHSLTGYDHGRNVSTDGVVEEFVFTNPHPVLMIAVLAGGGLAAGLREPRTASLPTGIEETRDTMI